MTLDELKALRRGDVVVHKTNPGILGLVVDPYDRGGVCVQFERCSVVDGPYRHEDDAAGLELARPRGEVRYEVRYKVGKTPFTYVVLSAENDEAEYHRKDVAGYAGVEDAHIVEVETIERRLS